MQQSYRLSTSDKRVLSLLSRRSPLSKRAIADAGGMGWATVVNSIGELIDIGFVESAGTAKSTPATRGRHAETYTLSDHRPLVVGIDVEYTRTHVALINLKGSILAESMYRTVQDPEQEDVVRFLTATFETFREEVGFQVDNIAGVGLAIPGIAFPSRSPRDNLAKSQQLSSELQRRFGITVRVAQNTKAYTAFQNWFHDKGSSRDFMQVSIRTGVGTGIVHQGQQYLGTHGLAGEIGHLKVGGGGLPCRCGKTGCLETVVNERYLFEQYRTRVLSNEFAPNTGNSSDIDGVREGLRGLFDDAVAGNPEARRILDTVAGYLGRALAATITTLDINYVIISGHFGPHGAALLPPLRNVILSECLPNLPLELEYAPFDPKGYIRGAALLILRDFFADVPEDVSEHVRQETQRTG